MSTTTHLSDRKIPAPGLPDDDLPESIRALTHDLRGPLSSLQSCLSLLLSGDAGELNPDQEHFLNMGRRNIHRMDGMIEDMLTAALSKSETGPARRLAVDLGPVLRDAVLQHRLTAAARGLELDDTGLPAEFFARVDAEIVVRMLDNVLGNALKFTPPGGLVRVWLESGKGSRHNLADRLARRWELPWASFNLIVEDNGPGMGPGVKKKIFEPFNRGTEADTANVPGTGLGLSITRRLAESQGGEVRLVSLPGRGTTVWLKLPRDPASEHFRKSVDHLEHALAEGSEHGVRPLVGVLDLRGDGEAGDPFREDGGAFFDCETSGFARGWEAAPGVWLAAVMDPVNHSRRWTLYAARRGKGLESTRWEYLNPAQEDVSTPLRSFEEQSETMFNSAGAGPNKW